MLDQEERVVLVDEEDRPVGDMDKIAAHRAGALHRAISAFVFDPKGRLILQRRALGKYHCGGRWANTCCSHPRVGETPLAAAHRRLREELGFDCPMSFLTQIRYRAEVGGGLIEHELVSVFAGGWAGAITPDPAEVSEWRAIDPKLLRREIEAEPEIFAPWLRIYVREHFDALFGKPMPAK